MERDRDILRHMLATIAYRGGKAIRGAPEGFGAFRPEGALNTPGQLLAHIGDLIDWSQRYCGGDPDSYRVSEPLTWEAEIARFYAALESFDHYLMAAVDLNAPLEELFQAPIADILTHIGQLALLRRMAGEPVPGEPYRMAAIVPGRVGPEQEPPAREFPRDKGAIWRKRSES